MRLLTFLQDLPAFERFSEEELEAFIACCTLFEFPEGHVFSSEQDAGDATYLLISGRVRVFQHDTVLKKTLSVNEICSGEIFNILALVENLTVPTTAVALEPSIALKFPRDGLGRLKTTSPRVAHQFQYMVAIQLANALFARNAELRARL
ncbi:MAG TPA: cyclic nucleotide-binding domain-containing protein [Methylophilaceae bacterium]|jgi:CRP/FNR family cyclic AMP-dependent transcriptional regulator